MILKMKLIHYPLFFILLILTACSSDENTIDKQGRVKLTLKVGKEKSTRTGLASSENLQHVEKVHLYVFNKTTDIETEATYFKTIELKWDIPSDVPYRPTTYTYYIDLGPGN